jgi:aconitase A
VGLPARPVPGSSVALHAFLQSAVAKFGAVFSRPGNGICHQVHRRRRDE